MEILKKGNLIDKWNFVTTCRECQAELKVDVSDLYYVVQKSYSPFKNKDGNIIYTQITNYFYDCPECKNPVQYDLGRLPSGIYSASNFRETLLKYCKKRTKL
jgi:hypothetical protein